MPSRPATAASEFAILSLQHRMRVPGFGQRFDRIANTDLTFAKAA
jgi:hypothetical protein